MITVSADSLVTKIIRHLNSISDQGYTQIATSDVKQRYLCRFKSSGIRCRVHCQVATDNSRVLAASICLCLCPDHHPSHRFASSITLIYILYRLFESG